jgi:transaldolase
MNMSTSTIGTGANKTANTRLRALSDAGVSVWLDQISRSLISGGELARLVAEQSLRGVTSNPAIFEKAILGGADYDAQISELARSGLDADGIYDAIAVADVQGAADVLADVHADSGGRDGFVSIEVPPKLARDPDATLVAARRYWRAVGRPNTMIKIPGTPEGVAAIEQATYEGINVNITLLFAVSAYSDIADAYIRGLERRHAEGLSLDVRSVASFFVSRVDTNVDRRLEQLGSPNTLRGTAALANARAAYGRFKQITAEARWRALHAAGAAVQRPLWASTGVKNPNYPDTLYVDNLIGPHTVNTMPLATLAAVADHGEVPGLTAEHEYRADLDALAEAGVDMDAVTDELLVDGIRLFEDAMDALLAGIEQRRIEVLGSPTSS